MAASFPTSVKSFTTKVDGAGGDLVAAADVNGLQDEVIAIETELKKTTGSVVDHGGLAGLADNDHPQYSLATHDHDADYLGVTAKAADSDKLNGEPASYYQPVNTLGAWQAWTPSGYAGLTAISSSTFRYCQIGNVVLFYVVINETATATPTAITVNLPVNRVGSPITTDITGRVGAASDNSVIAEATWAIANGHQYLVFVKSDGSAWSGNTAKYINVVGFYEAA